jgi:very-short-patch-repair endonuclease
MLFEQALAADAWPAFEQQYRFHPKRRWVFDFAWPEQRLAVEIEGGIFVRGRHVSPRGFVADCEKYNEAAVLGWTVLRIPVVGKTWLDDGLALLERYWVAQLGAP